MWVSSTLYLFPRLVSLICYLGRPILISASPPHLCKFLEPVIQKVHLAFSASPELLGREPKALWLRAGFHQMDVTLGNHSFH